MLEAAKEIFIGLYYGLYYTQHHIIHSFIIIPIGMIILLAILYGFNQFLDVKLNVNFPASVLGSLINLVVLCVLSALTHLASSSTKGLATTGNAASYILEKYLTIIKPPMNFSLKWINVCFIPAFIILPLSKPIRFVEVAKIAGVFVVGGLGLMLYNVFIVIFLRRLGELMGLLRPEKLMKRNHELPAKKEGGSVIDLNLSYISAREDITTVDVSSLRSTRTNVNRQHNAQAGVHGDSRMTEESINLAFEMDDMGGKSETQSDSPVPTPKEPSPELHPHDSLTDLMMNLPPLSQTVALIVINYVDWIFYLTLFIVSIPLYYIRSLHILMIYHLSITVLAYYVALLVPMKFPKIKKIAHPILVLTAQILFVCFIGSLIYHKSPKGFLDDLRYYKTGKNYLKLFNQKPMIESGQTLTQSDLNEDYTSVPQWPGCGDVLSSLMDVSIVSLSLPMFTHRKDFVNNFWILIPILSSMALCFFCYPIVCHHIGIQAERSIGFIGRLITLALGTPLIESLGGSVSLMAVCTILSGICGVLLGDYFFKFLRIPADDFLVRGMTLGINCGAIATAHLLNVDPRAASISSLSFGIYGTTMIILASIGPVRELIRLFVGL